MGRHDKMQIPSPRCSRRQFIALSAAAAAGAAVSGCATNPVTGKSELMFVTEQDEIGVDRAYSPLQISTDFGPVQDAGLNAYVNALGMELAQTSHRPHMPYSFRALNSPFIDAYTFPAGTVAISRGLLLEMEDEAALAAVLGHEVGHVNMRHYAQSSTQQTLTNIALGLAIAYVQEEHEKYAELASGLGAIGAGALLAHYSRQDEREADQLGMEYAVRSGRDPAGMVRTMEILLAAEKSTPNLIERMFSSHPMSRERLDTARQRVATQYAAAPLPANRERFMDETSELRRVAGAIKSIQQGASLMMSNSLDQASQAFQKALKQNPRDYAGMLLMANCCRAMNKIGEARRYAAAAHQLYPSEPQSSYLLGLLSMQAGEFGGALAHFGEYRTALPSNPMPTFFSGLCKENMGRKEEAAQEFVAYLQNVKQGEEAEYAYTRLVEWGVIQPQP